MGFEGTHVYRLWEILQLLSSAQLSSSVAAEYICRYEVRMALVDLDSPPIWWQQQAKEHMAASEARAFAGTDGASTTCTQQPTG